mmetsp:Transcript_7720/g.16790  ORF Transcript_7720/g.16790 Transcript_7720/m.16790 type:complete len:264 (+) Transcript_7720:27-818(+)
MRRRGGPTATATADEAPVGHTKQSRRRKSPKTLMLAAVATVALFGAIFLCMAMFSNSSDNTPKLSSLRRSAKEERDVSTVQGLIIRTYLGNIRIHFRPDLAGEASIKYIVDVVQAVSEKRNNVCQKCTFYRVEKHQILEGILADESVPENKVLGPCPDPNHQHQEKCPKHNPYCGCHGPIMMKGMVAWSHHTGMGGGPDFIITTSEKPMTGWGGHHTVWGEIRDEESFTVVDGAEDLPIDIPRTIQAGMQMLKDEIEFSLELF